MALGRGLNALISNNKTTKKESLNLDKDKVWYIPVSEIEANIDQPRKHFDEKALEDLSNSIREHGVLQPLLVVEKKDGGYELVAGERRLRASKLAGLVTVPAMVKKMDDQQKLEIALIENIQREDLNPLEEAFSYKRLIDEFELTQEDVSKRVGKSRSAVANTIRLLELSEEAKQALVSGKIKAGQARALLSLKSESEQLSALKSILGEKITVRELERVVRKKSLNLKKHKDPNIAFLEDELRSSLGAKVLITNKGGQGNITISYHSEEELKEIVNKFIK